MRNLNGPDCSPGDPPGGALAARRLGRPGACDCLAVLLLARSPARASALARTTSGLASGAVGPHPSRARAGPAVSGYGCVSLSSPRPVAMSGPGYQVALVLFRDWFFKGRYEPPPHRGVTRRCARGGIFRGLAPGTTVPPGRPAGTTVPPGNAPRGPGQGTRHPARDPARLDLF